MNSIQTRLDQDHREIEALLDSLAQASAGPNDELRETFDGLESRLLRHMEIEEEYLFPLVAVTHAAEVDQTRIEHARIRQLVSELGLAIELHAARRPKVVELIEVLRAHAAREDQTVYPFAGERASTSVEHRVVTMLKGVARSVLESAKQSAAAASDGTKGRHRAHP